MKAKSKAQFKKAWKDHLAQLIYAIEPDQCEEWELLEMHIHAMIDRTAAKLDIPDND